MLWQCVRRAKKIQRGIAIADLPNRGMRLKLGEFLGVGRSALRLACTCRANAKQRPNGAQGHSLPHRSPVRVGPGLFMEGEAAPVVPTGQGQKRRALLDPQCLLRLRPGHVGRSQRTQFSGPDPHAS